MSFPRCLSSRIVLLCLLSIPATALAAGSDEWRPLEPADLTLKTPVVEKDADAEAIFWEVKVADDIENGGPRTVLTHYLRIKIFTDRGRESQSRIDIPYFDNWSIKDVAARTIKVDGTIVELKKEDVFDRTIVKASGQKLKAKSFVMPGVEPGAIIEYRWREVRNEGLANYIRLQFQRDIPVQLVKYYVKPLKDPEFPYGMRFRTFQATPSPLAKEKNGFYSTSMANVPAFHEEARMPPEDAVRPWMLIYYALDRSLNGDPFWRQLGKENFERFKSAMKPTDEVKQAAAKAIGDAATPDEKLQRLFDFCRTNIKNIRNDSSGMTTEERSKVKENKSATDTLKHGVGSGYDIDMLFAAMATAAGLEARVVNLSDRGDIFLDKSFSDDYFIRTYDIAVRIGESWHFYDPGSTYVPFGMLRWQEEGGDALLADAKEPAWLKTPLSTPDKSQEKRRAHLQLSDDGTLEGDVSIAYSGHFAIDKKNFSDGDSATQREETLRDSVKSRLSTAELSNIKIENATDPVKPFIYSYHIKVAGYAQRTGKRLFLQPAFFQRNLEPIFTSSQRQNAIYFHYPWSEDDEVTIDLPEGYALDSADAPAPFNGAPVADYKVSVGVSKDGRMMVYKRYFFFGGGGNILFPLSSYPQLKAFFERLHTEDNHIITLKQGTTSN